MTRRSLEDRYVTLRWIRRTTTAVATHAGRYRWALLGALLISALPTAHLVEKMLTTGYPKPFWGFFGRVTTFPGYLVLEGLLGYWVPLADADASYSWHVTRWVVLLLVNLMGWMLILAALTALVRILLRRLGSEP